MEEGVKQTTCRDHSYFPGRDREGTCSKWDSSILV